MRKCLTAKMILKPALLTGILLFVTAGCSSVNLGQIDETEDPRLDMPGPGVFSNDDGESAINWSTDNTQSPVETEQPNSVVMDDKSEFEQFKIWNKLRTEGVESDDYQEFLRWLDYRKFKSGQ